MNIDKPGADVVPSRARGRVPPDRPVGHDGVSPAPLASDVFSEDELKAYMEAVGGGVGLDLAARSIGSTGTRMRALRRRDPAFAARLGDAQAEGYAVYQDRLRATARTRATAAEAPSDRILEVELATHVPGYEHLRRDRVKVEARLEHAIVFDPSALDRLPPERLLQLRELLVELGGDIIDGTADELPADDIR